MSSDEKSHEEIKGEFSEKNPLRGGSGPLTNTHGEKVDTNNRVGRLVGGIPLVPKYVVAKNYDEGIDLEAVYYVLRVDTDPSARAALRTYAEHVQTVNTQLARDITNLLDGYSE